MRLRERICLIRLTSLGIKALEGVITVTEKGSFEALARDQDKIGIWVVPEVKDHEGTKGKLVVLVKWEYLATIQILEV